MIQAPGAWNIKHYGLVIYVFSSKLERFWFKLVYLSKPKVTSVVLNMSISCKLQIRNVLQYRPQGPILGNFFSNLRIFVVSQIVCPWQAFPAQRNIYCKSRSLPLSRAPERCLTLVVSCLTHKYQISQKSLPGTYTLTYYVNS